MYIPMKTTKDHTQTVEELVLQDEITAKMLPNNVTLPKYIRLRLIYKQN